MFELQADGMSQLRDAAQSRMLDGYPLPDAPDTGEEWNDEFNDFAEKCMAAFKLMASDHEVFSADDQQYLSASDATIMFGAAIIAKDVGLVRCYHRLIQKVSPRDLLSSVQLLRQMHPETPVHAIVTEQHALASKNIKEAMRKADEEEVFNFLLLEELIASLTTMAFNDLTQTDRIVMLIKRGVYDPNDMKRMLLELDGIESSLLEGTL